MKRILTTIVSGLVLTQALCAQTFTANPGFSSRTLFSETQGSDISAIGSDAGGNIYYLDTGNFGGSIGTELIKRTAAASYTDPTPLFTYSGSVFGNFVKINGSTVYFGESTTNTIRSVSVSGGTSNLIATIPFNYDLAFNGSTAFVDAADSNFVNNTVSRLDLSTGQLTTVLKTNGASGPLAFASNGSLLYGASTFHDPGGIYSFSAAQVAGALSGTPLTLSDGTLLFNDGPNQYLASRDAHSLFQADSSGSANFLKLFDPTSRTSQTLGQIDTLNDGDLYGGLAVVGNGVAVSVASQFGTVNQTNSTVFFVTPEPTSASLFTLAGAWIVSGRRFRRKRRA